jgi:hypothetical protein
MMNCHSASAIPLVTSTLPADRYHRWFLSHLSRSNKKQNLGRNNNGQQSSSLGIKGKPQSAKNQLSTNRESKCFHTFSPIISLLAPYSIIILFSKTQQPPVYWGLPNMSLSSGKQDLLCSNYWPIPPSVAAETASGTTRPRPLAILAPSSRSTWYQSLSERS